MKSCPLNDVLFEKSVVNSLKHMYPSYSHHLNHNSLCHKIVGSCNGLVCIVCKPSEVDMLFIWNPSTKISTMLYSSTFDVPPNMRYKVVYGFAYEKATDDYKIVAVYPCDQYQYKVTICSLKTENWKHIGDFPHGYQVNNSGVFSNGYLHWMATRRGANGLNYPCTIVSFDLANETFGEVSQPVYFDEDDKDLSLGVLGEWLCVLCNYWVVTRADVWVMKVYGVEDSWTKLASVKFPADTYSRFDVPLFISNDGTILMQAGWKLVVYDSRDGSCSKVENLNISYDATTCVESLVSPLMTKNK